jgi:alpha-glucosidase (family GH31 glycosyl hydrolase)
LLTLTVVGSRQQSCPVDIADGDRRDCYPWTGASQSACESRGCVWCESATPDVPWCFYDDTVCPSEIGETGRSDCMPEGGGRADCLLKGCVWCESETPGVPWCFHDSTVSQGGQFCPSEADVPLSERIDCHPDYGATVEACVGRGCYWCDETPDDGTPYCFMPPEQGYRLVDIVQTAKGYEVTLTRVNTPSWYGLDFRNVLLEIEFQTDDRLRIKFSDAENSRYEVPLEIPSPDTEAENPKYEVTFTSSPVFSFKVTRKSTAAVVFDTSIGGLVLSDQFLQIATRLDSANVYGFGEHEHPSLKHDMDWVEWAMYARDQAVNPANLYGVQPFYMNVERSGNAHAVLFLNSNAQDVSLMPAPALTYRTIGGVLDMYMFFGPSPVEVISQYNQAVGLPIMVPYWSLGFQLCRYGYTNLEHMQAAVGRMRQYDIPHDIQYADIDYMDGWKDFTLDEENFGGLPDYVKQLRQDGTRFIIILDPAIYYLATDGSYPPFDRGNQQDVWVKTPDGAPAPGRVWPGAAYFPDYSNPNTQTWWTNECVMFHDTIEYDGLWIDMNEPANFANGYTDVGCANTNINDPPFVPKGLSGNMYQSTLCPDAVQTIGMHYNVHSLYGWTMAKQSLPAARAATGTRSVVFSRSTFPGGGHYAQHWLGDNWSNWANLKYSLIGVMEFNMFGYPYVGPDICGFIGETNEELCERWQEVGAFYTFSRNHNAINNPDQDPGIWPEVARVTRETLHIRYNLLPFLYTLFYEAHTGGVPVIRPVFFEFPSDPNTYSIDEQMMWGGAFLISPVLYQGATTKSAYFPDARWYSYYDGAEVSARGATITLDAPLDFIPLHIQGGYILPTQQPANSTVWSRSKPMGLIVALDDRQSAAGSLFWDDGESLDTHVSGQHFFAEYSTSNGHLTSTVVHDGYTGAASLVMDDFRIFGISTVVSSVNLNGSPITTWQYDSTTKVLTLNSVGVQLNTNFSVDWS